MEHDQHGKNYHVNGIAYEIIGVKGHNIAIDRKRAGYVVIEFRNSKQCVEKPKHCHHARRNYSMFAVHQCENASNRLKPYNSVLKMAFVDVFIFLYTYECHHTNGRCHPVRINYIR